MCCATVRENPATSGPELPSASGPVLTSASLYRACCGPGIVHRVDKRAQIEVLQSSSGGAELVDVFPTTGSGWARWRSHIHLRQYPHELAEEAVKDFDCQTVAGTTLLTTPAWIPERPVPLDAVELTWAPDTPFTGITGTEDQALGVLPQRPDGSHYRSYADAVGALAAPKVFENLPMPSQPQVGGSDAVILGQLRAGPF